MGSHDLSKEVRFVAPVGQPFSRGLPGLSHTRRIYDIVDYVNYIVLTWPGHARRPAAGTHGEDRAGIAPYRSGSDVRRLPARISRNSSGVSAMGFAFMLLAREAASTRAPTCCGPAP